MMTGIECGEMGNISKIAKRTEDRNRNQCPPALWADPLSFGTSSLFAARNWSTRWDQRLRTKC